MSPPIWRSFIHTCLVLEENQQHIIKAHLGDFVALVESQNCPSSWVLTLYRRAFNHENKKVQSYECIFEMPFFVFFG